MTGLIEGGSSWLLEYLRPFWQGAWGAIHLAAWLMVFLFALEICFPGRRLRWKTVVFNAVYIPIYLTLAMALAHPVSKALSGWLPANLLNVSLSSNITLASMAWFAVYLLVFDFFYYWFHRAQHSSKLLWRYHMLHHSDENVSMSTSARHHWLEEFLRLFFIAAPVAVLFGGPGNVPLWMNAALGLYGLIIHWNMPLRLGFLQRWIVTPWYHRVHHSTNPQHFGKNFAVFFPFWDWLFNTRHLPGPDDFPETGIAALNARAHTGLRLSLPWPMPSYTTEDAEAGVSALAAPLPKA